MNAEIEPLYPLANYYQVPEQIGWRNWQHCAEDILHEQDEEENPIPNSASDDSTPPSSP